MPFDLHSWRERIARLAANSARAILTANNGRVALSISVASFLYKKALPLSHLNKAEFFGSELMTKSEARRRDSRGLLLTILSNVMIVVVLWNFVSPTLQWRKCDRNSETSCHLIFQRHLSAKLCVLFGYFVRYFDHAATC